MGGLIVLDCDEFSSLSFRLILKILTFNIHNGINWNGNYDLEQIAKFIGEINPDLAGIQEVGRFWSRKTNFQDMATFLGERLGMFPVFSASLCREDKAFFGNLILSKYPILKAWTKILPGNLEPRNYLAIQVQTRGVRINFLTTHLGLSNVERLCQVSKIIKFGVQLGKPLIITGDFNEKISDSGVALLKKNWVKHDPFPPQGTIRLCNRMIGPEIDMIFSSSDFVLKNMRVCENYLSDHLPVIAELELNLSWPQVAGKPVYLSRY